MLATALNTETITSNHFVLFYPNLHIFTKDMFHSGPCTRKCPALSKSRSHVTTDGQSASMSWNKTPIWGLRPDLYYCQIVAGLLTWGALPDERTGLTLARVTASSNVSCRYVQFAFYMLLNVCIYNIHKASVSPGSVQQIMPYH
jgi:hypothetical protein